MALFAPTNITPSSTGQIGSGVVDVSKDFTVSWQVNGNSALQSYQIVFYKNDTASTQVYDTGKIVLAKPFYGTDYKGEIQLFEHKMLKSVFGENLKNGNKYKFIITQWWSGRKSVTQPSASAFETQTEPNIWFENFPNKVSRRDYTFEAHYSQLGAADAADAFNWVRWRISSDVADPESEIIFDTGKVYGTAELKCYYNGFFPNKNYTIRCDLQTERGTEITTGWHFFPVRYEQRVAEGDATATVGDKKHSAVLVEWGSFFYIYGKDTGDVQISNGEVNIGADGKVVWDDVNGAPMYFRSPWNILVHGRLKGKGGELLRIRQDTYDISLEYDENNRRFAVISNQTQRLVQDVSNNAEFWFIFTPTETYTRWEQPSGGLYPKSNLYPSATLYPSKDNVIGVKKLRDDNISYIQSAVTGIELSGPADFDYVQLISGALSQDIITQLYDNGAYTPAGQDGTQFQADFDGNLNAGGSFAGGAELKGWSVYRQTENAPVLDHLADLPIEANKLYDYSARSCQGRYSYYIFPVGTDTYITTPVITNQINPRFWNWTILEAVPRDRTHTKYEVVAEYSFGKNVATSAISNNNTPGVMQNFTRFPTIQRSPLNYLTGSLTAMIGVIDYRNGQNKYSDSIKLRDALYNLSTTNNTLFLKSRKGDLMEIAISSAITMQTTDGSIEQAQEGMIPWIQIGDAKGVSLISLAPVKVEEPKPYPHGRTIDMGSGNLLIDSDAVDARYNPVDMNVYVDPDCAADVTDDGDGNLNWWWW